MTQIPLHELLDMARKNQDLTLLDLVNQSNLSYGMVYRILKGTIKKPNPQNLKKLALPLALNYEYLLEKAGYLTSPEKKHKTQTILPILSWEFIKQFVTFTDTLHPGLSEQTIHLKLEAGVPVKIEKR